MATTHNLRDTLQLVSTNPTLSIYAAEAVGKPGESIFVAATSRQNAKRVLSENHQHNGKTITQLLPQERLRLELEIGREDVCEAMLHERVTSKIQGVSAVEKETTWHSAVDTWSKSMLLKGKHGSREVRITVHIQFYPDSMEVDDMIVSTHEDE